MPVTRVMLEYVHPWPNHAGLFLARHNGGFARAGLDVELISDGYDRGGAPAMLARGEYDVASQRPRLGSRASRTLKERPLPFRLLLASFTKCARRWPRTGETPP